MRYLQFEYGILSTTGRDSIRWNSKQKKIKMIKYIGSFLALLAALVCIIFYISGTTSNTLLVIAIIILVAAIISPIIVNKIQNKG